MRRQSWPHCVRSFAFSLVLAVPCCVMPFASVYGQQNSGDMAELMKSLQEQGVLGESDVARLRQKYGDAFDSPYARDALIAILKAKGVPNAAEVAGVRPKAPGVPPAPVATRAPSPAPKIVDADESTRLAPPPPLPVEVTPPPARASAPVEKTASAPRNAVAPPPLSPGKMDDSQLVVSKEMLEQIKREVAEEVRREMARELRGQMSQEVRSQMSQEVKSQLAQETKAQISREAKSQAAQEIKTQVVQEAKAEVAEDLKKDVKQEVQSELQNNIQKVQAAIWPEGAPDWIKRIRFGGDMRLRYEGDYFAKDNAILLKPPTGTELMNTRENRERGLVRLRLAADAQVNDEIKAGVRITTGNDKNPVTLNSALEMTKKDDVVLDLAYLQYKPTEQVSVTGGRMVNPYYHTNLVWAPDLSFTGLAGSAEFPLFRNTKGFLNAGVFSLKEIELSADDKWLYGFQAGIEYKPVQNLTAKLAAAYYGYDNIVGKRNPVGTPLYDYTIPDFQQKGNTLMNIDPSGGIKTALASDFKELNITGSLDLLAHDPVHVIAIGDYVKNLGFNKADVIARTGNPDVKEETTGYQMGLIVGYPKMEKRFDWQVFFYYRYLEADAVVDAFTDSDFHLGGTNAKGWVLGGQLGLMKNVWLTARWLTSDEISGPPLAIDTLQVDLNARF